MIFKLLLIQVFVFLASKPLIADETKLDRIQKNIDRGFYKSLSLFESVKADPERFNDFVHADHDDENPDVLVVVLGGHSSCRPGPFGQKMAAYLSETRKILFNQFKMSSHYFLSCYGSLSYELNYTHSGLGGEMVRSTNSDLANVVLKISKKVKNQKVAIIGHSYGGWLAIDLAVRISNSVDLRALVSIDPISQVECRRHMVGANLISKLFGDTPSTVCGEFPADFEHSKLNALEDSIGVWRNYFQTRTRLLHSGPIVFADSNSHFYSLDKTANSESHFRLRDEPIIWSRFSYEIDQPSKVKNDPDEIFIEKKDAAKYLEKSTGQKQFSLISNFSVETFLLYQKSTLSFFERRSSTGSSHKVARYIPGAPILLGVGFSVSENHAVAFMKSIEALNANQGVSSHVLQMDYSYINERFLIDLLYEEYEGFFLDRVDSNSNEPLRDSLFEDNSSKPRVPSMKMNKFELRFHNILWDRNYSMLPFRTSKKRVENFGWGVGLYSKISQTRFSSSENLLPQDLQESMNIDYIKKGRIRSVALLPSLGVSYGQRGMYSTLKISWGPSVGRIQRDDVGTKTVTSSTGNIQAALGYNSRKYFYGISGLKNIVSMRQKEIGISTDYSAVKLAFGHHF